MGRPLTTMRISTLIKELQSIKRKHGDIGLTIQCPKTIFGGFYGVNGIEVKEFFPDPKQIAFLLLDAENRRML
jgi:hypothetical protein